MTINKKVRNWAHVKSDMMERRDPLWVPSFHKTSDVSTFKFFLKFVAVRSFTADSSLLQPTEGVNTTPHTSYFHSEIHAHTHGSNLVRTHSSHLMFHTHCGRRVWLLSLSLSSTTPFTSPSFCPSTSSSRMWWTNSLCTSAEDLGTLAEYEPPTKWKLTKKTASSEEDR